MSKLKFRDNVRDVVYVSGQPRSRSFLAYGIEFYEFERNVRQKLRRLLLLKHQFGGAVFIFPLFSSM